MAAVPCSKRSQWLEARGRDTGDPVLLQLRWGGDSCTEVVQLGPRGSERPSRTPLRRDSEHLAPPTQSHHAQERRPQPRGSLAEKSMCNKFMTRKPNQKMDSFQTCPSAGRHLAGTRIGNTSKSSVFLEPVSEYMGTECTMPQKYVRINLPSAASAGPRRGGPAAAGACFSVQGRRGHAGTPRCRASCGRLKAHQSPEDAGPGEEGPLHPSGCRRLLSTEEQTVLRGKFSCLRTQRVRRAPLPRVAAAPGQQHRLPLSREACWGRGPISEA